MGWPIDIPRLDQPYNPKRDISPMLSRTGDGFSLDEVQLTVEADSSSSPFVQKVPAAEEFFGNFFKMD